MEHGTSVPCNQRGNIMPETTKKLEEHFKGIIKDIGEDINRDGLLTTPERAAKAFRFLTKGYT